MAKHSIQNIEWREVVWQRPFNEDNVYEMLTHLATLENRGAIIWESRSHKGYVKHIILYCKCIGDKVIISGNAALFSINDIVGL